MNRLLVPIALCTISILCLPDRLHADFDGRAIQVAFFTQPGCSKCRHAKETLRKLSETTPVEVREFPTYDRENRILLEALCQRAEVPEGRRLVVPAVFASGGALIGEDVTPQALDALLKTSSTAPTPAPPWQVSPEELKQARQRLIRRFRLIGVGAVLIGGLLDGINPCAFATLVFLIGYLTMLGRKGVEILVVGGGFCTGVFVVYFATGLGLSELLFRLEFLPAVSRIVTLAIIALTAGLAVFSLVDYLRVRKGHPERMTLKIPSKLRRYMNWVITRRLRSGSLAGAAFVTGAIVSVLEFVCTGQIYLPILQFMSTVSVDRTRSILLLLLYNLAFVMPLVWTFLAAYKGAESQKMMDFLKNHLALTKLLLAVFFTAMAAMLLAFQWRDLSTWLG